MSPEATDEVDTKTLSTKKSVLIVGQPHLSHFKYYGATPSPISGKVKVRPLPIIRRYIHLTPFPAFSFDAKGPKEKANKKKMP